MLTNISGTNVGAGYQAQLTTSNTIVSSVVKPDKPDSSKPEDDDTVSISREAKSLEQVYQRKETTLEQKHNNDRQQLERAYQREKNNLEREFSQKKQALEINIYA